MTAKAKPKTEQQPTPYVVLELREAPIEEVPTKVWHEIGRASGKGRLGRDHAIEQVVADKLGAFKAVEAKSWDTGIEREQETRVVNKRIGGAA